MKRALPVCIAIPVILIGTFLLVPVAEAGCDIDGVSGDCADTDVVIDGADNNVVVGTNDAFTDNTIDGNLDVGAGNDTVLVTASGTITGDIFGGQNNDTITVDGTVNGTVRGGAQADTIVINGTAGNVDGTPGNDNITINGSVPGNVLGADGADTLTIAGEVGGNVLGNQKDDTVILQDGASVGGMIDGGVNTPAGDTLVFDITITIGEDEEARTVAALLAQGGEGSFAGFTWTNFENLLERLHFHVYSGNKLIDCGKDPYLGQRPFNMYCEPYTGDPNESALDGLIYGETDGTES